MKVQKIRERELLIEIARLYYMKEESQAEIAKRFAISRSLVSKLLKRSRNENLVHITIDPPENTNLQYESQLMKRFGLHRVIVESTKKADGLDHGVAERVGERAARYLETLLRDKLMIGIEWGTSLYHMIDQMHCIDSFSDITIVQLHGVIDSASLDEEGVALARALGKKLHAHVQVMQAPMMVEDAELRERLAVEPKIADTLEAARQVDIACIGIGTNKFGRNVLTKAGYLTEKESLRIKNAGGTAMISGWFIDEQGTLIDMPANKRIIGLNPEYFKKIPLVIGVAYGKEKSEAIYAALRGGYIDVLITDTDAVQNIVHLEEEHNLSELNQKEHLLDAGMIRDIYRKMYLTRIVELRFEELFNEGLMHGTTHLCIGQEASSVVPGMALKREDLLFGTHRGHGQAIGKGLDPVSLFSEMFGKETGCSHGHGGSMHLFDHDLGIMGMNGIVAGALPIAAGAALSIRRRGEERVVMAFLGDGTVNEGAFHETMNLAAIWRLPIIFICENNQYGFSKRPSEVMIHYELVPRVLSYGISPLSIDGNDAELVYQTVKQARRQALACNPQFLILSTYRIAGHSKSDRNRYREPEEIAHWKEQCPVGRLRDRLISRYAYSESDIVTLEQSVISEVQHAEEQALQASDAAFSLDEDLVYSPCGQERCGE